MIGPAAIARTSSSRSGLSARPVFAELHGICSIIDTDECRVGFAEMRERHRLVIQPAPDADDLRHEADTAPFGHSRKSDPLTVFLV